jgi:hypothetical protein
MTDNDHVHAGGACDDERDYPGVASVTEFLERRRRNWDRLYRKKRQAVNA